MIVRERPLTAPRGLPGVMVDRVEFQRAGEGRALDDVVVHGRDSTGSYVVLEIQVKREITFAPKDEVFREVIVQKRAEITEFSTQGLQGSQRLSTVTVSDPAVPLPPRPPCLR